MLHSWLNLQMWNHKYRGTADAEELVLLHIYIYIYIYIHTHTHTYIYIYTQTYMYIYIHIFICWLHWVFITRHGLSLVDKEGCSSL